MVIESNQAGIYLHAAYATDENGTDFSLTSFPGAVYIGNYMDRSATESTDPTKYTWKPLYTDTIDPSEIEDDSEAYESVDVADVQESVEDLSGTANSLSVRTNYNEDNIEKTQSAQDEGLGNLNLLVGTNQGATGWSASSSYLTTISEAVYSEDPNDAIDTVGITVTTGADTLIFDSSALLDYIAANNEEENTYTLSYDIKVSNTGASMSVSVPGVLTFDSPEFTDEEDDDLSGTWLHFTSTATIESTSGTDLAFVYSGSANDTLQIANLKVEAGALATPWRASLEEVEGIANTALTEARAVSQHFWTDSNGAHITEVTQAQYIADPTTAGGNTLITSSGMDVRDGTDTLASFGSSGAQVGQSGSGHTTIAASGMQVFGNNGSDLLANIGYGAGSDVSGGTSNAPYYTLGTRDTSQPLGNYSLVSGRSGAATKYGSSSLGIQTQALGLYAQSENYLSSAQGESSHAEGMRTYALADYSHSQNYNTIANGEAQTAIGKYNISDTTSALIIGNGASGARSNALTVDWSGNVDAAGTVTVSRDPTSNLEVATKRYVDNSIWTPTHEVLRNGIGPLTTTLTNYGTNSINLSDYKFIEIRVYNSSYMASEIFPIETIEAQVGGSYPTHEFLARLGTTNYYLSWQYSDDTHLRAAISGGSNIYMGIYGIK